MQRLSRFLPALCSVLCQLNRFPVFFFFYITNYYFPPTAPCLFKTGEVCLMALASLTSNPYYTSHSSFTYSFAPSLALPPLRASHIYFSEVFLIWQESRPGRFPPQLRLSSQLLCPAGAALRWVPSSIWGLVHVCVCALISTRDFPFAEVGAGNPDRCLVSC